MTHILPLAVLSGLSLNLVFHFGADFQSLLAGVINKKAQILKYIVLLISSLLVWMFFTYILSPLALGFMTYFLLFPISALLCAGLEKSGLRLFLIDPIKNSSALSAYNGLGPLMCFFMIHMSGGFADAVILSIGFSGGCFLATLIVHEIAKKSSMETVPRFLRGTPLLLVALGLLSLVSAAAAALFISALGSF